MSEPQGVTSLDDLLHDLEGTEKRAAWIEGVASAGRVRGATRDLDVRPAGAKPAAAQPAGKQPGEQLVARRAPELRARYRTLFHLESQFEADLDFGCLIASGCQVLETELTQLLTQPAKEVADDLVRALAGVGRAKQADLLEGWAAGKFQATIGTASLILLALRQGLEAGNESCRGFLARYFRPAYAALAATRELGTTLDRVREGFRNPACHGTKSFDRAAYEQFAHHVVARRRFAEWAAAGPLPDDPPGTSGLLHHHLAESLLVPAGVDGPGLAASPLERLLDLGRPRASRLGIRLEPHPAHAPPLVRDLAACPPRLPRPFRLGDSIRFALQADQDCEAAVLDIGTSGKVAVVLPNAWQERAVVPRGQVCWLPDPVAPKFDINLGGRPGRERVVALAWLGEPAVPLRPEGSDPFRVLTPEDITRLCDTLEQLDGGQWAACVSEFEIVT